MTVASNGNQALDLMEPGGFDLVLMDIQMPEMDGIETTKHIRAQEAKMGKHTPVVAITAHAMKGDREKFLEAGMDNYVSKPIKQVNSTGLWSKQQQCRDKQPNRFFHNEMD